MVGVAGTAEAVGTAGNQLMLTSSTCPRLHTRPAKLLFAAGFVALLPGCYSEDMPFGPDPHWSEPQCPGLTESVADIAECAGDHRGAACLRHYAATGDENP